MNLRQQKSKGLRKSHCRNFQAQFYSKHHSRKYIRHKISDETTFVTQRKQPGYDLRVIKEKVFKCYMDDIVINTNLYT